MGLEFYFTCELLNETYVLKRNKNSAYLENLEKESISTMEMSKIQNKTGKRQII